MSYAINLRIPISAYVPEELRERAGRVYVNVSAFSTTKRERGNHVILSENCRNAEVLDSIRTGRAPSSFFFNLDN